MDLVFTLQRYRAWVRTGLLILGVVSMSACMPTPDTDAIHATWIEAMKGLHAPTLAELAPSSTESERAFVIDQMQRFLDGTYRESATESVALGTLGATVLSPCRQEEHTATCLSQWEFTEQTLCFQLDQRFHETWHVVDWTLVEGTTCEE
ncbi:MAG: hypothetical protein AAGF95_31010 [Chloroflexota bacterium]